MKVLFVQKFEKISGSEKYFQTILPLLRQAGIDVHFCSVRHERITLEKDLFHKLLSEQNITHHPIFFKLGFSPSIVFQLNRLIKQEKFDIVHTNLIHADLWGAIVRKFFRPRAKFISMFHGYDEKTQKRGGFDVNKFKTDFYYHVAKFSNKYVDHSIVVSEGLADFLIKGSIIKKEKTTVIHLGFDFSDIKADKEHNRKYRFSSNQIVSVGRLVAYKQQELLIGLIPRLKLSIPDIKLVLVGSGEEKEKLQNLAKEKGQSNAVIFAGYVSNAHDYIASSDIMVIPSMSEGFGVVILEGWYHKKPVIAFNVPAPNEIITDGMNGFLIKPYDVDELGGRILELLTDKNKTQQMGEHGLQTLNTVFSTDRMLEKTVQVYHQVLKNQLCAE